MGTKTEVVLYDEHGIFEIGNRLEALLVEIHDQLTSEPAGGINTACPNLSCNATNAVCGSVGGPSRNSACVPLPGGVLPYQVVVCAQVNLFCQLSNRGFCGLEQVCLQEMC